MNRRIASLSLAVALAALLVPSLVRASTARGAVGATSVSSLVLSPSDVGRAYGPGFILFLHIPYGARDAAKIKGCARYSTSYTVDYANTNRAAIHTKAVVSVISSIFRYSTTTGPACALRGHLGMPGHTPGTIFHSSPLSGVGDGATIFTAVQTTHKSFTVGISFYRGSYTALVLVSSLGAAPSSAKVTQLARNIDRRIQSGG